jgi:hypothetical protein
MHTIRKLMLLPLVGGALILAAPAAAFDQGTLEAIFAAEGKDAAKAYCESLKEAAQEGTEEEKEAGEQAKEECDAALEALEAAADQD